MPKEVHNKLSAKGAETKGPGRHADGAGLYLVVSETGARWWQWRGVVHGRRREIGMGSANLLSLKKARMMALEWRRIAREGGDPAVERDRAKRVSITFEEAARKVHAEQIAPHCRNEKHAAQWLRTLEIAAFPRIGKTPVHAVQQADLLRVLNPIWMETPETARRVKQRIGTVLDWATAEGLREGVSPIVGIDRGLPKQKDKADHFAALPWKDLPDLYPRIVAVDGMGALALRFAILTAVRSGDVRGATWAEIDMAEAVWTIPAERIKAGVEHRVPLSGPALRVLEAVRGLSTGLVFPSRQQGKALSDMTLAAVLKRLGVPVTVHGFRSTFRDWAEEATTYSHEVKEAALAHAVKSQTERAYRRTDLFEKRRGLMDEWAAFVDPTHLRHGRGA